MKRIDCPSRAGNRAGRAFAAILALTVVAAALEASASTRPKNGGTLRVQVSERVGPIDPRLWPSTSAEATLAERVDSLVFDRLVRLDERGALQPALAISWRHDRQYRLWEFRLREGVKFSDGTPLTPHVAAMALQQLLGASFDVTPDSDSVAIQIDHSMPDLPAQLARGRYFVFHAPDDHSIAGTGPFIENLRQSMSRVEMVVFVANESCWAGRPFVDKIALTTGVDMEQQTNAVAFSQGDVVELPASQVRRATQRGVRIVSSDPIELFTLIFDPSRASVQDPRLRQAISLAIDRASIADVILQKQGVAAGGLLPNWISGYSHLFPVSLDVPRARDLLAASRRELSRSAPLVLVYDSGDAEARAIADRVAVNLREVGIMIQVSGQSAEGKTKSPAADVRLVRHHIVAPDAVAALSELLPSLGELATDLETSEQAYEAERAAIDAFRVIPLVHVTESYGLAPQVRDWMAPRWGGWNLADVWLEPQSPTGSNTP
jgi:peptide/nickel transport system substrate-binding protein